MSGSDDLPNIRRIEVIKFFFDTHKIDHLMPLFSFTYEIKKKPLEDIKFVYPQSYDYLCANFEKFHNGNIAIKKNVFDKIKWTNRPKGQDVEFNEKAYREFKSIVILEPLTIYRIEYSSWKKFIKLIQ